MLVSKGFAPKMELAQGYWPVLRMATSKDPSSSSGSGSLDAKRRSASLI
jgi:hypothetical protein